ncbi:hypothetical protein VTG60DRAFT_6604 [Thermothelomyces hinnuleus]
MPTTEIITIINNSGKVISTGKQLVGIFKEAQAAYRDRREAVKAQRAGIQRAKTFDVARGDPYYDDYHYHGGAHPDEADYAYDRRSIRDTFSRRRSHDDGDTRSYASSRYSRHSRRSRRPRSPEGPLALTEGNLKAHSEISATSPSQIYRAPRTETAPRDMELSRQTPATGAPPPSESETGADRRRQLVHRPRSDPALAKKKSIDMNLAYGDIPPDLESRVDLDPVHDDDDARLPPVEDPQEAKALSLMDRIEEYLEEAHCVQKTASAMIESLQRNPDAAAAVALSLAELSALIGKMSPAFLAFLKGGSPAVFALLASPQFLIGAGVAVGVTVVMFGGWKIVKSIKDTAVSKTLEAPLEMRPVPAPAHDPTVAHDKALPPLPAAGGGAAGYEEALVLKDVDALSSIETWRRGIVPFEGDAADIEQMSREAERALQEQFNQELDEVEPCDSVSQVSRARSDRSRRSHRSHRTSASRRYRESRAKSEVSDRKSSSGKKTDRDGGESEAVSERSHRSHRSSRGHEGSTVSRSSKHSSKVGLEAIEERDGERDDSGSAAGKPKEKKRDMIKQLFKKKKDKEDRERAVSVLV